MQKARTISIKTSKTALLVIKAVQWVGIWMMCLALWVFALNYNLSSHLCIYFYHTIHYWVIQQLCFFINCATQYLSFLPSLSHSVIPCLSVSDLVLDSDSYTHTHTHTHTQTHTKALVPQVLKIIPNWLHFDVWLLRSGVVWTFFICEAGIQGYETVLSNNLALSSLLFSSLGVMRSRAGTLPQTKI